MLPRIAMTLGFVITALGWCRWTNAADPPPQVPTVGVADAIFNDKPSFLVAAEVNRPTREYREGDFLTIRVTSEEDAYLYVLYQQADGQIFQVFPNKFQQVNLVKARQAVRVPAESDLFRWSVGAPYGKEVVKVIATKEPVDILSKPELSKARFNPVSAKQLKGVEIELGEDKPIVWGETDVELHTYANAQPPEQSAQRRWGVFFGVSKHKFNVYKIAAGQIQKDAGEEVTFKSNDLSAAHRDAQKFSQMMKIAGRLDGLKLLTNEQATKANMQEAITRWLPSVARPGDTVVIYYSGHTGQMTDLSGDETDGKDEYLVPHDIFGPAEFNALGMLYKAGKLNADDRSFFENQESAIRGLGENPEAKMIDDSGITDDLMARWLKRLDGRQVVFISDSCHSGGFAQDEATYKSLKPDFTFNLFEGEAVRLKNLGQSNHAIFCAAHANETATERVTSDMGVMTYCIVEFMNRSQGSQRLEDCFKVCQVEMQRYFDDWNKALAAAGRTERITPSHPFMINHSSQPVFLKP